MPDWTREFYYYRVSLVDDRGKQTGVVPGGRFGKPPGLAWLGRCAGELAGTLRRQAGSGSRHTHCHVLYTCQTACQTHVIHMPYTWSTHCFRSCSVTLGHSRSWMLLATGGVIHQAIVSLLCCTFTFFQGFCHALPKKQCSHHIPKITTVDIQPDGKYIFRKNYAVDKRQKSLRLHLLT